MDNQKYVVYSVGNMTKTGFVWVYAEVHDTTDLDLDALKQRARETQPEGWTFIPFGPYLPENVVAQSVTITEVN